MRTRAFDAQAGLGFLVSQLTHIEPQAYEIRYADIQYPQLVPVDTSAPEWIKSVTYYSMDKVGAADWINENADDIPKADVEHAEFETGVHAAGIGYGYGLGELNQAALLGIPLTAQKAMAARRAAEEMIDRIALLGDTVKGFQGLIDHEDVTATPAENGDWDNATPDEIIDDVNQGLTLVQTATNNIVQANTLLLPYAKFNRLASRRLTDTSLTILEFIRQNNVYTATTGAPLTMRAIRRLDTAGLSASARMVAYRRDPEVLKLHMPMPHRFFPVWQSGPFRFEIPGMFRLGGLDIRLPSEVQYVDGI